MDRALAVNLACLWEATAHKLGNVHRGCDFDDLSYLDFVQSAAGIAPVLERAPHQPIGLSILQAIQATRQVVCTNTNLGIVLLLTPLAAVTDQCSLAEILRSLTLEDSRNVYRAIRLANPGGMGRVKDEDLSQEPTLPLLDLMRLAEDRDRIAWQYTHEFRDIFDLGVPALEKTLDLGLERAIQFCQLTFLANLPDSLIARKHGPAEAEKVQNQARVILSAGWPTALEGIQAWHDLDLQLRTPGQARNPGTTADLITACLFVLVRDNKIKLPICWSQER